MATRTRLRGAAAGDTAPADDGLEDRPLRNGAKDRRRRLHRRAVHTCTWRQAGTPTRISRVGRHGYRDDVRFLLDPKNRRRRPHRDPRRAPRWLLRVVRRRTGPRDSRPERKDRLHREHGVYVGLDARSDGRWVTAPPAESIERFANGKVDAFIGFPTIPQELRARGLGRVVVNSTVDRPWSQYCCCLVAANREFVRKHPAATKRALRALLKAVNVCAVEPERAATMTVEKGVAPRYEIALQVMKDVPYARWRDYDAEDSLRFYALRLHEAGIIRSSPQKISAQGTDWRFLNELKKELKG